MANSVYVINKGVNKSIEFKGLRAQYIWYLGGGIVALLVLFAILYIIGVPSFICIGIAVVTGAFLFMQVYKLSNKYGEHGMMKQVAKRSIPTLIKCNDRKVFKKPPVNS
ncbi:DUF4133 domain-containing protein [Filimonas effusa]|uniref:DUF4133 domain-containing protein n=1 Tax=Filimonas effusa TaxID=2508721 RepID=A0A4Q1D254_9BACT|nr:DUF4133 domain-containing protein [Filimonas effusa]RXK81287.1 DUF4133 domain-containing protein [Filimonas effusa]